ncbi:hypothetical protein LINPERHAP1_LOCUS15712, partial [Linum perenne]
MHTHASIFIHIHTFTPTPDSPFNYLIDHTGVLLKPITTTHNPDHITQIINSQIPRYN